MPKKPSILRSLSRRIEDVFFLLKGLLDERHFIYLSAVVVAVSCAFAVILLKAFAHYVFLFATYINGYVKLPFINSILPIVGILLTVFVIRHFLNGSIEKGSSQILFAVARKGGIMPKKQMYAQIVTSSLTVGLGGSAGLESPITITGAAFGSNFAQKYKLSQKDRILLLSCGVAAGIGAAFNAPIAGVLFAIEVILTDVTISAFIPIIISAATGALVSNVVLKEGVLLSFREQQDFNFANVPYYVLLGILAGFVSVYHARQFRKVEAFFNRIKNKSYRRAIFGALILAVMIFFFPTLFGEGYESIRSLADQNPELLLENTTLERFRDNEWIILGFLGLTALLKATATGITLGSGGNGGNFAPSLFVGSYLGFVLAKTVNLLGIANLPLSNFTLVGMAGILSGLFHAPLTAIFLIGEITGGYSLMVPLMIVSSISFAVSRQFEKYSMDVKHLADKGEVFTSDKDRNILSSIDLPALVDKNCRTLSPVDSLSDAVNVFSSTRQAVIAVTERQVITGVIYLDDVRHVLFNSFRVKFSALSEIVSEPKAIVRLEDGVEKAIRAFEDSGLEILPVTLNGKYFGILDKTAILACYRDKLREMVIE